MRQAGTRISELENEEVDELRFDRIKIQRKRMQHILDVIKQLSFKNKELVKQNTQLKQDNEGERHYKMLYEEVFLEKKLLAEKNLKMSEELQKYRESSLHQEIIINSLKEELYNHEYKSRQALAKYSPTRYFQHHGVSDHQLLSFEQMDSGEGSKESRIRMSEYMVLKSQYDDLKKQYSNLYKKVYAQQQQNNEMTGFIYSNVSKKADKILRKAASSKHLSAVNKTDANIDYNKLKSKYDHVKAEKKALEKQVVALTQQMRIHKIKQKQQGEILDLLKEKKTKLCLCHVHKFQKKMSQKNISIEDRCL